MPAYPPTLPDHVIEAVDAADRLGRLCIEDRMANRAAIRKITPEIERLYDSGMTFFTKDAMRDISRQIDEAGLWGVLTEPPASFTFTLKGIDGKVVEFPLAVVADDPVTKEIGLKLMITFRGASDLTSLAATDVDLFNPDHAFLSMSPRLFYARAFGGGTDAEGERPEPLHSATETLAKLRLKKTEWDASEACREVVATLDAAAAAVDAADDAFPHVDKVVAFTCSNVSSVTSGERFATQHALALTLRDFFAARQRKQPKEDRIGNAAAVSGEEAVGLYAQDPAYHDQDREALSEMGFTVLDNPRGFVKVDDSSVVFSLAPETPIRQIITDIAKPAVMVWDRVYRKQRADRAYYGRCSPGDEISPRVEDMIRTHYVELPFPVHPHFGKKDDSMLCIYVRKGPTRSEKL